jgi:hypothetical protein
MPAPDSIADLQQLCELGQSQLMRMEYLAAERTLIYAEKRATALGDFDTLGRLYMPLQEARRQRRQRCGEGVVCLDLLAEGPNDHFSGQHVVNNYPHGQLLVAGWASIEPALRVRELQREHDLYVETFLAAVYPIGEGRAVAIFPTADVALPRADDVHSVDELIRKLPAHSIVLAERELPRGVRKGTWQTYAEVMAMWERLHAPFLAAADAQPDPLRKIEAYRQTIRVDYACELAHQKLSDVARNIARQKRESR